MVGGDDPAATGIEIEVARGSAPCFLDLDQCEPAAVRIDPEAGDAVVPAVGAIEESSAGMNEDLRGGAPGPAFWWCCVVC